MTFDPVVMALAPLVVVAAYTVFGISGFGSALVSIPLLAHLMPLKTVVPMVLLLDFSAAFLTGLRLRADVARSEMLPVVPGIVIGVVAGVLLLSHAPGELLLVPLGLFVTGYASYNLMRSSRPIRFARGWGYGVGLAGGLIGALFGVAGPLYATYFSGRLEDPARLRATLSAVFSLSTALRIVMFLAAGLLLRKELWLGAAALLPFMVAGTRLGQHLHRRISASTLVKVLNALLVLSGLSLAARGLHALV